MYKYELKTLSLNYLQKIIIGVFTRLFFDYDLIKF